jgi:hypothetical protein
MLSALPNMGARIFKVMDLTGCLIEEAGFFVSDAFPVPGRRVPTLPALIEQLATHQPRVIEALWDGDSSGWHVRLVASCQGQPDYDVHLAVLCDAAGDLRLFKQEPPIWAEAAAAKTLGLGLAERYSVPFYFPSPHCPEEDCPRWAERDLGVPCRTCGLLLLQSSGVPWWGVCHGCR